MTGLIIPQPPRFVMNIHRGEKYDVYIGRPGPYGNRFIIGCHGTRAEVIAKHEQWVVSNRPFMELIRRELRGKRLGCYCYPLPCHGDLYARIANPEHYMEHY